jgi:hypothetical protein
LVHFDASKRCGAVLALAAGLASRYSAHLKALYVIELPTPALFYGDASGFVDARLIDERMSAARTEREFHARVRLNGIEAEWRTVEGFTAQTC